MKTFYILFTGTKQISFSDTALMTKVLLACTAYPAGTDARRLIIRGY